MAELFEIHNPANARGAPRIVFFHGLDGHYRKTWMTSPKNEDTLWPKWLGEDTGCPVWLLSYEAAMSRWKSDAMALPRQATAVLERLSTEPTLMEGPLVLVGHSLGGLIIKMALRQGLEHNVERHARVVRSISGIAFVGTPHFGSKLASIAAYTRLMRTNPQVSDLRLDNAHLEDLNYFFLGQQSKFGIVCRVFTETQPVRLPWWLAGRFLPGLTVVSPTSSQVHIPGEVGIPIEANHIGICKPESRRSGIYPTMLNFIREVKEKSRSRAVVDTVIKPLPSDQFEAKPIGARSPSAVHLAFSTYEVEFYEGSNSSICAAVCIVTDAPHRLLKALEEIRQAVINDSLVPASTKELAVKIPLVEIFQLPGARSVALRSIAAISFSAYLYYCPASSFNKLSMNEKIERLFLMPLVHRLSKKSERIDQIVYNALNISDMPEYLEKSTSRVKKLYGRMPKIPKSASPKYRPIEELAAVVAEISCRHLAGDRNDGVGELFENLRTRIRYAENVATGECHKRDVNPMP